MDDNKFLILCDTNFNNVCEDPIGYLTKLEKVIKSNYGENSTLNTITGKRGLTAVDYEIDSLEIFEKNKTVFKESFEEHMNKFDYLILLTLKEDQYLGAISDLCSEYRKTIIRYKYKPRS